MNLKKAIEIATQHQKGTDPIYLPDLPDAIKLLIEAGKRHLNRDYITYAGMHEPLPGETKD